MLTIRSFCFSPIQENTYVLYDDLKNAAIIDPGCYYDEEKDELRNFIETNDLKPVLLLNTHCHLDHVFGNKYVAETWNLKLHLHPLEEEMLKMAPASGLMFNIPFDNYEGELIFLEEGNEVKMGDESLKVILAPGHSPGSVCFHSEDQKFAIAGDVLFYGSIGRTDLPGGDHETLLKSIREKLFILPDDVKIYPGHGEPTTIGYEKKYNPFLT